MPSPRQLAKEILKELTEAEIGKLSRAKFDTNKLNYTEEWDYMHKRFEPVFDRFLVDEKERDEKTSKVIYELILLKNERLRDSSETDEYKRPRKPTKRLHEIKYPDAYNDNKPEVVIEKDAEGNIYHKIKESEKSEASKTEASKTRKTIPENAENVNLFPELFNKPK